MPDVPPERRDRAGVAPASGYRPDQTVWAYRAAAWRPAIVLECSAVAVLVRYLPTPRGGTGVDTVTAVSLAVRDERVESLDRPTGDIQRSPAGRRW